jgi:hypothetical protein
MTRNRVKATTTCFLKHNLRKVKNAFAPTRIIEQSQITNNKYQTNNNDQNSKFQTCFGH